MTDPLLTDEVRHITRTLDVLYERQRNGDNTAHLRGRIRRWEAVQAVLQGYPAALMNTTA